MKKNKKLSAILYILLITLVVISLFPFFWLIRSSLMTSTEIFSMPMQWLPKKPEIRNYYTALTSLPFLLYFGNTLTIVILNVLGNILSSSFVAFGFSRIKFKGRGFWFILLISTMMIPYSSVMIPQFIGWRAVGAYNTFLPLILPAFFGNAFYIFLLRQFYMGIPKEYDEAAFMDGANYLSIYAKIIIPMSKPALTTVGVFTFMGVWNDFFGPLLYLSDNTKYTLALGLRSFIGQYVSEWNLMMAVSCVIILPMIVLFFFAQKTFIEGITFTGLKG
ncbi:MAG TPA: carbohydrate ABC transporter permease [Ruminiclostridium sp.]